MKKKLITAALVIILAILMITPAFAIVEPTKEFYVADYANVLTNSTEQDIIEANAILENTCDGAQIVVVSVEYLDGLYADEYALRVMNDWGVGSGSKDNGMVLLFATKENKGWLATGDGIDNAFTDSMADKYLNNYFWKHYDNGNYDKAVSTLLPKLVKWYENEYASVGSKRVGGFFNGIKDSIVRAVNYIMYNEILMYFLIIVILVFINSIISRRQHYRAYYTHMGMPIPRFHIWHVWSGPHIRWRNPNPPTHNHSHYHSGHGGYHGSGRSSGGFRSSGRGGGGRSGGGGGGRR